MRDASSLLLRHPSPFCPATVETIPFMSRILKCALESIDPRLIYQLGWKDSVIVGVALIMMREIVWACCDLDTDGTVWIE